jgi:hypothetical protein
LKAYVESSVLLRVAFSEPDPSSSWHDIDEPVTSELTRIECLRTLDRARTQGRLDEPTLARVRADLLQLLDGSSTVSLAFATHDRELAIAAESLGFTVLV